MSKLPKVIWDGQINIGPVALDCCVLDNGQRIIAQHSVVELLEWMSSGDPVDVDMMEMAAFCKGTGVPKMHTDQGGK